MGKREKTPTTPCRVVLALVAVALAGSAAHGQQVQEDNQTPPSAEAAAPVDLTGTWVSVITEDWRWRMVTPARGDYASVPITEAARIVADAWDPARDEATGEACRSYGAAAIMRVPGRIQISWQDENTLRIEADAGTQTRLFHFEPVEGGGVAAAASWQGQSVAQWETEDGDQESDKTGSLKVVTTNMRPGYLRKNGVPYSADAVLTEYFDLNTAPNGDPWLVVTSELVAPEYLQKPYVTSPNFKEEANDGGWDPTECSATW